MVAKSFKIYLHRVLLILTYAFLAILVFGFLGQSFLSTILDFAGIILGASVIPVALRKVLSDYNIGELFRLCLSLAFLDWLLYKGNNQFEINIENKFQNFPRF